MAQNQCPECKSYNTAPMKTSKVLSLTAFSGVLFWIFVFIVPPLAMIILIGGGIMILAAMVAPDKRFQCKACKFHFLPESNKDKKKA